MKLNSDIIHVEVHAHHTGEYNKSYLDYNREEVRGVLNPTRLQCGVDL